MKSHLGIVGGGQLGQMLTLAAKPLGFTVWVIDPTPESPAGQVADHQIVADVKDSKAIKELGKHCDFITFEVELADDKALRELEEEGVSVNPSPHTLGLIKDKFKQKEFLKHHGIPVADFLAVETIEDISAAADTFGYPFLLKARSDAYDGRGNALIKTKKDITMALEKLKNRRLYVEKFVPFVKELAIMVARNHLGEISPYQVVETVHKDNICHTVTAPAPIAPQVADEAKKFAVSIMKHLRGAGVFGIEMFLDAKNTLYVNEIAPRVHNAGHYTIEACITSQFEQHVRAVCGLPLGDPSMKVPAAVMINILGERDGKAEVRGLAKALGIHGVSVHIYGKKDTRPQRKMGHMTVIGPSVQEAAQKAKRAREALAI